MPADLSVDDFHDFHMFRNALTELERLVDVCGNTTNMGDILTVIGEGIIYKLNLLIELDINTSESNVIEELERLVALKRQTVSHSGRIVAARMSILDVQKMFDRMIDSKTDFIKKSSFSQLVSGVDIEPMAALERLTNIQKSLNSKIINEILKSKIKEIVYTPRPKASPRNDHQAPSAQFSTISSANVVASTAYASQKQEIPERDLSNDAEESKTTAKFATSPLLWLQDQDENYAGDAKDDDDSTENGGALTPTSTIVSGKSDY